MAGLTALARRRQRQRGQSENGSQMAGAGQTPLTASRRVEKRSTGSVCASSHTTGARKADLLRVLCDANVLRAASPTKALSSALGGTSYGSRRRAPGSQGSSLIDQHLRTWSIALHQHPAPLPAQAMLWPAVILSAHAVTFAPKALKFPSRATPPADVVVAQLDALRRNDVARTYELF